MENVLVYRGHRHVGEIVQTDWAMTESGGDRIWVYANSVASTMLMKNLRKLSSEEARHYILYGTTPPVQGPRAR